MNPLNKPLPRGEPPGAGAAALSSHHPQADPPAGDQSALASVSTNCEVTVDYVPGAAAKPNPSAGSPSDVQRFGNYELLEPIGKGGMGLVYKARQLGLNRVVALKRIRAGELAGDEEVQRFYAEAEAAAALDHSGIVAIHEVGQVAGQPYFSMAYVPGESLQQRLAQGPLQANMAAWIVSQVADAVEYAHQRGIVHRDLKPANILLDANGHHPRVTDFGLAKRTAGSPTAGDQADHSGGLTLTGQVLGTPAYMPPEQARSQHDRIGPRSDVYGLGAVLYAMLTGRPPFQAASYAETLRQVIDDEPVAPRSLNPSIPVDLESIALKCLEKEPERRYASAADLSADIMRYLTGEATRARPIGQAARLWRWCRRRPAVASLVGLSALLLFAVSIVSTAAWLRASADAEAKTKLVGEKTKLADDMSKLAADKAKLADEKTTLAGEKTVLAEKESKARQETERQLRIATANRLAAQSTSLLNERPITAMLLAGAAAEAAPGEPILPGAELALRNAVATNAGYALVNPPGVSGYNTGCTASPNGRWFTNGKTLWDLNAANPNQSCRTLQKPSALVFSPDSRWMAGSGESGTIRIWDLEAGPLEFVRTVRGQKHTPALMGVSNGGQRIVWFEGNRESPPRYTLYFADVPPGDLTLSPKAIGTLAVPGANYFLHAMSADGRWLVIRTTTSDGTLQIWDLDASDSPPQGKVLCQKPEAVVISVLSSDGKWLVGHTGERFFIWNLEESLGERRSLSWAEAGIPVGIHDDILLTYKQGRFVTWELYTLQSLNTFELPQKSLPVHKVSSDLRWALLQDKDEWLIEAVTATGRGFSIRDSETMPILTTGRVFAPNQKLAVEVARVWDLHSGPTAHPKILKGLSTDIALSGDGQTLVTGNDSAACVWDLSVALADEHPTVVPSPASRLALSPDGRWLVTAGNRWLVTAGDNRYTQTRQAKIWDLGSLGQEPRSFELPELASLSAGAMGTRIDQLVISPDSRWLAAAGNQKFRLWDLSAIGPDWKPKELIGYRPREKHFYRAQCEFSCDSRILVTSDGHTARVWNLQSPDPTAGSLELESPSERIYSVAISSDGRWLFAASGSRFVRKWDLEASDPAANSQLLTAGGTADWSGASITLSPNDRWLVLGNNQSELHVWDLLLDDPAAHPIVLASFRPVNSALGGTFSPNSRWFASHNGDVVQVWDLESATPAASSRQLPGHARGANILFSPDSRWLVTTSNNDGRVRLWLLDSDDLLQLVKTFTGRSLNSDEMAEFAVPAAATESLVMAPKFRPGLPPLLMHQWPARPLTTVVAEPKSVGEVVKVSRLEERRAVFHANAGRWREAQANFRRARLAQPLIVGYWWDDALTLLGAGDQSGYQQICGEVVRQFGESDPATASRAAQICALGPDAVQGELWTEVRAMAQRIVDAEPENWNYRMRLGVVCYRAGDYPAAVSHLKRAAVPSDAEAHIWIQLFLAMAYHQTQQPAEARRWLEFAEQQIEKDAKSLSWGDRLLFQLNLAEARALCQP